jgi:hypothetical protein
MLRRLKKHWLLRWMVFLLLVNFVNLSANFYQSSIIDFPLLENHDPIDSIAELVLEYMLDMDDETIPDTEVPHEKNKFSDLKLHFQPALFEFLLSPGNLISKPISIYLSNFYSFKKEINSPPPKIEIFLKS